MHNVTVPVTPSYAACARRHSGVHMPGSTKSGDGNDTASSVRLETIEQTLQELFLFPRPSCHRPLPPLSTPPQPSPTGSTKAASPQGAVCCPHWCLPDCRHIPIFHKDDGANLYSCSIVIGRGGADGNGSTAMAVQLSVVVVAPPAPLIGLDNCATTCVNASVPYPFDVSLGCFWPGLKLTCDTNHSTPRLLLGDGTIQVIKISLRNHTVRASQ
ncbi:hypothetical protein U9M48_016893 [Paspalum notatum var. saurae]|uniref:Wall-associated receptor kinase galacturonan-binding domain-containing protein n=1 Tax=Paspalum notatum var. saurae TaxID=547442 RepID=A0AAQ3T7M8_PASNO